MKLLLCAIAMISLLLLYDSQLLLCATVVISLILLYGYYNNSYCIILQSVSRSQIINNIRCLESQWPLDFSVKVVCNRQLTGYVITIFPYLLQHVLGITPLSKYIEYLMYYTYTRNCLHNQHIFNNKINKIGVTNLLYTKYLTIINDKG